MSAVVVLAESEGGRATVVSREVMTFARDLADKMFVLPIGPAGDALVADCAEQGATAVFRCDNEELERYSAAGWAVALGAVADAAAGELVAVDVEGEDDAAAFTFRGMHKEPEREPVPAHAPGSDHEGPDHIGGLSGGGHVGGSVDTPPFEGGAAEA